MPRQPRLLAAISDHGYGHLAILAPVVQAAHQRFGAHITIQTGLPHAVVAARITVPFDYHARRCDLGMLMDSAIDVRAAATAAAYAEYHRDFAARVADEARWLRGLAPDLVLASVPYLTLAAARRVGVPALAACSLNWAALFGHYCGAQPGAHSIQQQMLGAYRSCAVFLRPAPSMPMPELDNARAIGPIARVGRRRREELKERISLRAGERVLVAALGGIATELPVAQWPRGRGLRYVVPDTAAPLHPDAVGYEATGLPFVDLLCSADAVLAKPGYGTFAEAACNDIALAYVRRGDWPEEPSLTSWLHAHARAIAIERDTFARGDFLTVLETLAELPGRARVAPTGLDETLDIVLELL